MSSKASRDTAWSWWQFLWRRWTSEVKCVTSGRCFNPNYTCPCEEQVPLSSLHFLLAWAAASMSKKGLSHRDGEANSFPGPDAHQGDEWCVDEWGEKPPPKRNRASLMNNVEHCFEIQGIQDLLHIECECEWGSGALQTHSGLSTTYN